MTGYRPEDHSVLRIAVRVYAPVISAILGSYLMTHLGLFFTGLWLDHPSFYTLSYPVCLFFPFAFGVQVLWWAEHRGIWRLLHGILPLSCLLLGGFLGRKIGDRKGHPRIGVNVGIWLGVILGGVLMGWLSSREYMDWS